MGPLKKSAVSMIAGAAAGVALVYGQEPAEPGMAEGGEFSTHDVACDISHEDYNPTAGLESRYKWRCSNTMRVLSGNGVPDHAVGEFPNRRNPSRITEQSVAASMPLSPRMSASRSPIGNRGGASVYALNSVKFDPATAGACPDNAGRRSACSMGRSDGQWRIEALSQDVFDFGEDMNKAHVQPTGEYHYHGVPEGMLQNAGVSDANKRMLLVGWAADGFPVYARYCHSDAMDLLSDIKICEGSYELDATADRGRPSADWIPLGAFTADWNFVEGSGDLDECNGRLGATPEFPEGIYYYMATDDYPFFSRCIKGVFSPFDSQSRPQRSRTRRRR